MTKIEKCECKIKRPVRNDYAAAFYCLTCGKFIISRAATEAFKKKGAWIMNRDDAALKRAIVLICCGTTLFVYALCSIYEAMK